MFKQLTDEIKKLNADVADFATQEKAKVLRKQLIVWGLVIAVVGFVGVFVCFTLFVVGGVTTTVGSGITARVIVPFILFVPCGCLGGLGVTIAKLGLSILIGGETAKFVDKSINDRCKCGSTIEADEIFCSKCGRSVRKTCSNCGEINDISSEYCKKCGTKL